MTQKTPEKTAPQLAANQSRPFRPSEPCSCGKRFGVHAADYPYARAPDCAAFDPRYKRKARATTAKAAA